MAEPDARHDSLARELVDAAFRVHTALGLGLLESAYQQCMAFELEVRGIPFRSQVAMPIVYRHRPIGICSTRLNSSLPIQHIANSLIGILPTARGGSDDRSNGGKQIGAPA